MKTGNGEFYSMLNSPSFKKFTFAYHPCAKKNIGLNIHIDLKKQPRSKNCDLDRVILIKVLKRIGHIAA
jgi:hypothetical protein